MLQPKPSPDTKTKTEIYCSNIAGKNTNIQLDIDLEETEQNSASSNDLKNFSSTDCGSKRDEKGQFYSSDPRKNRVYLTDEEWELIQNIRKGEYEDYIVKKELSDKTIENKEKKLRERFIRTKNFSFSKYKLELTPAFVHKNGNEYFRSWDEIYDYIKDGKRSFYINALNLYCFSQIVLPEERHLRMIKKTQYEPNDVKDYAEFAWINEEFDMFISLMRSKIKTKKIVDWKESFQKLFKK